MKSMTCRQLGGACEEKFFANTFDEMAKLSRAHAMEMIQAKDPDHLKAMTEMQELMQNPAAMEKWFASKKTAFAELPEE